MAISEDTQAIISKLEEVRLAVNGTTTAVNNARTAIVASVNAFAAKNAEQLEDGLQERLNARGYVKDYKLDKIMSDVAPRR